MYELDVKTQITDEIQGVATFLLNCLNSDLYTWYITSYFAMFTSIASWQTSSMESLRRRKKENLVPASG